MARTVLYIDDQPQLPDRVDEILAQAGFELVHSTDPAAAMRIARESRPSLVLLELLHAGCDGFDLMRQLADDGDASGLPIVILTRGERSPGLYGEALEVGARDFLCKPVTGAQILETVLEFATGAEGEASPRVSKAPEVMAFEGDLAEQPLAGLLARLYRMGASGVLKVSCGSETCAVQFRNGSPVEIEKHRHSDSIADYLKRTGRIDAEQYDMLVDQLMARIAGPREILLGMEALTEEELVAANREQGRGVLLEMFGWAFGPFGFHPGEGLKDSEILELGVSPTQMLRAGLKQTPDPIIDAALERWSPFYAAYAAGAEEQIGEMGLPAIQRAEIESFMGDRTLAEIQTVGSIDARSLFGLCVVGAVVLDAAAVLVLDEALEPEPASPIRELPQQRTRVPIEADATQPEAIERRLDEIAERLEAQNDFELFGIEERSTDVEVRAGYDELLAALRLEGAAGDVEALEARVRDLSRRLDQAYQRVRTADTRRLFAGLRKKMKPSEPKSTPEFDQRETASRAVEAESWFRTGEGHLEHEDYAKAAESFGMAVHLDPEQGDYAACLGWSLYRSNPTNKIIRREALEHVAKAVKIDPGREKPLLYLSRIFRETGETEMAAKVLRRALRENPDSPALVQEMCLIDPGSSQSKRKKIFDRFRRS